DVPGEDHALLGQMDDEVADRMGGTDLMKLDGHLADREVVASGERRGRRQHLYAGEVEVAEVLPEVPAERLAGVGVVDECLKLLRLRLEALVLKSGASGEDVGAGQLLEAPGVVAIGVGDGYPVQ